MVHGRRLARNGRGGEDRQLEPWVEAWNKGIFVELANTQLGISNLSWRVLFDFV